MRKATSLISALMLTLAVSSLPLHAAATGHFERTLQVSGPVDLEVSSGSGEITVRTGATNSVSVSAHIHASNGSWLFGGNEEERIRKIEQNPPVEQQGNTIRIGRIEDSELIRHISIDYELTVPAQTKLNAHTGSGGISITGVQLPLTGKTGSGGITVNNIGADTRINSGSGGLTIHGVKGSLHAETGSGSIHGDGVAGEIVATTGSGSVELEQIAPGDARVETGSGSVRLRGIKGGLRVSTGSGGIHAEGEPTHDWHLGAGSGTITLKVPAQASFNLDARTSSGTLTVNNHQVTMQGAISKNHIQGKVGNGGVIMDVHTGSGNIAID
jgi:Putative adhesin